MKHMGRQMAPGSLAPVLGAWGREEAVVDRVLAPSGSPERCVDRVVVRDAAGECWLLEWLHAGQVARRHWIGQVLEAMAARGMARLPLVSRTLAGEMLHEREGLHWQLSRFIPGDMLPRPDYVRDRDRGAALAGFLAEMAGCAPDGDVLAREPEPSPGLDEYRTAIMGTIARREPELHARLVPISDRLDTVVPEMDQRFCHGDFHPLNVIWRGKDVAGVIDWEFAGTRPMLYDVANMLGCVGSEDPQALVGALAMGFVAGLGRAGLLDPGQVGQLVAMLPALRFAWMAEWLRRDDHEMIAMELRYLRILLDNADTLVRAWTDMLRRA